MSQSDFEDEGIPAAADPDADPAGIGFEGPAIPRDHPIAAADYGTTAAEERRGEPLDARLRRERPESERPESERPDPDIGSWAADQPAGRLVAPDEGVRPDSEKDLVADDVGTDLGGLSAEEAAVHLDPP